MWCRRIIFKNTQIISRFVPSVPSSSDWVSPNSRTTTKKNTTQVVVPLRIKFSSNICYIEFNIFLSSHLIHVRRVPISSPILKTVLGQTKSPQRQQHKNDLQNDYDDTLWCALLMGTIEVRIYSGPFILQMTVFSIPNNLPTWSILFTYTRTHFCYHYQ